jgi:1-acyl-sn-glycerol-3-phosphate acyltransferase
MFKVVRVSVLVSSLVVVTTAVATTIVIIVPFVGLRDPKRNIIHDMCGFWARSVAAWNVWWRFNVRGLENAPQDDRAVMYVCNHSSHVDILAVYQTRLQFRWLAKEVLFKIPWLGWAMTSARYVSIRRGDKGSHAKCMLESLEHLKAGTPMLFFPEGTRSDDGSLGIFRLGAFNLASEVKCDVVPISILGTRQMLPKHSIVPGKAMVWIKVHEPIGSHGLTPQELADKARQAIIKGLEESKALENGQMTREQGKGDKRKC